MNPIQQQIAEIGELLSIITGPAFEVVNKYWGSQLPYRWEARTVVEPIRYVATIELNPSDVLRMDVMPFYEKREYLRGRFAHLFAAHEVSA
jgi:hypothetical protein